MAFEVYLFILHFALIGLSIDGRFGV